MSFLSCLCGKRATVRRAMPDTANLLASAAACYRRGQLGPAEQLYRQVLAMEPGHAEALGQLGRLAYQNGQTAEAVQYLRRSAMARPEDADACTDLGVVLAGLGRSGEAEAAFREAL